jgi:ribosomal RNA-processing protein 8
MKQSLDGARFRWINEALYKADSAKTHQMMRDDPKVYEEYHTGFRHQVDSWPTNPVTHYVSTLSTYPPKTVIADLGCGDAALARALLPKGMVVLSFDLVSDGGFVVEADICGKLPLPGSEGTENEKSEGEAHVVDVVVCALSLMGTNWLTCIREAWRILKPDGELKIAEVASRFTDIEEFAALINTVGFKLKSKDESNSHFTLFEFKKMPRKAKHEKEWAKIVAKGSLLKPCEYKRR